MSLESLTVRILGDSRGFEAAMTRAGSAASGMSSRMQSVGKGMSTYVSLPLAAAGAASVKMAADFESSLQKAVSVTGLTGQAANKARSEMNALALQLGADTAFSAKEAADAMYDLASSGWDTQQMTKGLPGIMSLASSTQSDLASTTSAVTSTLAQFGLEAGESGRVADVFTKAIGSTKATMDDLSTGMKTVGPVANAVGWSLEETTAALASLNDAGISGAEAGTALRGAIASLLNPVGQGAAALKELGLSAEDVNPKTHSLAEILNTLKDAGAGANEMTQIFGREGVAAMSALAEQGGGSLNKLTAELKNSGGTAQQVAEQQLNTLKGKMDELMGSLETLAIGFGQILIPPLSSLAQALVPIVNWFSQLPGPVKNVAVAIIALAAAAGPLIWILGGIVGAFGSLLPALAPIAAFLVGPWGIAIAAVIAGIALLIANWSKIAPVFQPVIGVLQQVWSVIQRVATILTGAGGNMRAYVQAWNSLPGPIQGALRVFAQVAAVIRGVLGKALAWLKTQISGVVGWFKSNLPLMQKTAQTVLRAIASLFKTNFNAIRAVVQAGLKILSTIFQGSGNNWVNILRSVWNIIKNTITTAVKILGNVIKLAMQVITGDWSGAWETIKRIGQQAWNLLKSNVSSLWNILKNLFAAGVKAINNTWGQLVKWVVQQANNLKNQVVQYLQGLVQEAGKKFNELKNQAVARFNEFRKNVSTRVSQTKEDALKRLEELRNGAAKIWPKMIGGVKNFADEFKSTLVSRFEDAVNTARGWLGSLLQGIASVLDALGLKKEAGTLRKAGEGLGKPTKFARGGVFDRDRERRGGILRSPMGLAGEAGPEALVPLSRRTREGRDAAIRGAEAQGLSVVSGRGEGYGATHYQVAPEIREVADKIASATGTQWNTYSGHGWGGGGFSDEYHTVDFWGGARGAPLSESQGFRTADMALNMQPPEVLYIIRQGEYYGDGSGWRPFPEDPHYDHTHVSWYTDPKEGVGPPMVFDVVAKIKELMGKFFDPVMKKMPTSGLGVVSEAFSHWAGGLPKMALNWLIEQAKKIAGSLLGGGGSGLRLEQAVAAGGWPSNLQRTAVGVAWEESSARADALNPSGAKGLFQIMPSTAEGVGADYGRLFDPIYNSEIAKKVYDIQGWGAWVAYPPSQQSMNMGDHKVSGYSRGGVVPGALGQGMLLKAHAGERVLPIGVRQGFDRLADSIQMWSRDGYGKIGTPGAGTITADGAAIVTELQEIRRENREHARTTGAILKSLPPDIKDSVDWNLENSKKTGDAARKGVNKATAKAGSLGGRRGF